MIINVTNRQSSLKISRLQVQKIVQQVLEEECQVCDEINIHFVDTKTISRLHAEYFNDASTTDCITFPLDDEEDALNYRMLGEVFVCPATALAYASKYSKDPHEETTLYLIHGLLHLLGYDDIEADDRKLMKRTERRHLLKIKKHGLQLTT